MKEINTPILVLLGPTAVGKTALSLELAERYSCEIVSVDSMQVYRFMDIGTAKPSPAERQQVHHHLIDIVDPDEQYNSAHFVRDALVAIKAIAVAGKIPLLTGGTGLYLKAMTEGLFSLEGSESETIRDHLTAKLKEEGGREILFQELLTVDPHSAGRIHINDTQRLVRALEIYRSTGKTWSAHLQEHKETGARFANMLQIGLTCERQILYERIEQRATVMLDNGLLDEAEKLQNMGYGPDLPSMQAIGYKHANNYLAGEWNLDETIQLLMRDTRRYAKRQMTWFSKNKAIKWFARDDHHGVHQAVATWLS